MRQVDFDLYVITDRRQCDDIVACVEKALRGGARAVQLRDKDLFTRERFELGQKLRAVTSEFGAKLIVNGDCALALALGADGAHLPQDGLPADVARGRYEVTLTANHSDGPETEVYAVIAVNVLDALVPLSAGGDWAVPEYWKSEMLPQAMRHASGHGGSAAFISAEFVNALVEDREPAIDLYESLAMTVPGIVAHQSSRRDGEQLEVPQFDPTEK